MTPLLELRDISIQFGGLKAVSNLSLTIEREQIVGLIGPNGAGKTTVFNLITGIYRPTAGGVFFNSENINKKRSYERTWLGIARTFQNIRLFKQLTVAENIIFAMHYNRDIGIFSSMLRLPHFWRERNEVNKKANEYLEYINMLDMRNERAENLPYGRQRELEIVRAIATGAELLLLDEPAAGMNPQETKQLMRFIDKVRNDMHKSVLLIEHDMGLVMGISDKVAVLDYGQKIVEGKPSEVQHNKKVIETYLGKGDDDAES
ncbi:ABC transporter ATP-binding protein [Deferribacterales bacterium RsTz2092]|nr:ABC transporter ATP-binding protein [Deferribacterales bacterium]